MIKVWTKLQKFAPAALFAGYAVPYATKGWDRVLIDLRSITIEKITAKYQNILIAAGAGAGIYFLQKSRLPPAVRAVGTIALYFIAGYNLALVVDPPIPGSQTISRGVTYAVPVKYNPYAPGGR